MLKFIIFLIAGAGIGALMGYFGKCTNGQCPLTANPLRGALWGLFLAGIAAYPMLLGALRKPVPSSPNILHITGKIDLDKILADDTKPVLIDFYADWCGPCRGLSPTINRLADEFKGRVNVIKINIDNFSDIAKNYGVQSIPTVIIINKGAEIKRITGANLFEAYAETLLSLLPASAPEKKESNPTGSAPKEETGNK